MNDSAWIWPASDMDFWKIDNKETSVKIKWSHNCFEDYKTLSYQFYKCGYKTCLLYTSPSPRDTR